MKVICPIASVVGLVWLTWAVDRPYVTAALNRAKRKVRSLIQ